MFRNDLWVEKFPCSNVKALPLFGSDHSPLIINSNVCIPFRPRPFRFEAMRLIKNSCDPVVNAAWNININGSSAYSLVSKLRNTSTTLSRWNKSTFGNIQNEILMLQAQLSALQANIGSDPTNASSSLFEKSIRTRLEYLMDCEETLWA